MKQQSLNILKANILTLENSMNELKRALDICSKTTDSNDLSPEEIDAFEGLTSRFACSGGKSNP